MLEEKAMPAWDYISTSSSDKPAIRQSIDQAAGLVIPLPESHDWFLFAANDADAVFKFTSDDSPSPLDLDVGTGSAVSRRIFRGENNSVSSGRHTKVMIRSGDAGIPVLVTLQPVQQKRVS